MHDAQTKPTAVLTNKDWISLPIPFLSALIAGPWADEQYERWDDGWRVVWPKTGNSFRFNTRGNADCEQVLERLRADAIRVEGDAPSHGYVNADAAHMPEGIDGRLAWDERRGERGERGERDES